MKASDYVARFLRDAGCTNVFGVPGGAVTHLIDSMAKTPGIQFIGTYHEQGAAFAAEGYARWKNSVGVAMATSGPGATNLITGIGSAWFDSIPCLYLTGQVNTYEYKGDLPIRQRGFQETDIVSIAAPITKYAVKVDHPARLRFELEKALCIATSDRPGPVLLDLPMDVQRAELDPGSLESYQPTQPGKGPPLDPAIRALNGCKRPVILSGGGVRLARATQELAQLANELQIPIVTTLMGRDSFDNRSPLWLGMTGTYGHRLANLALANSDLILALGARLDSRQTGTEPESFARAARLIRVDVDEHELQRKIKPEELAVKADIREFLTRLNGLRCRIHVNTYDWLGWIDRCRASLPIERSGPQGILDTLTDWLPDHGAACLDVGANQMWAAQLLNVSGKQRVLTSGGMGSMGFALPAAIGAWYAGCPSPLAIAGDGGIQMNIQELALVHREGIPVKIVVLNNGCLGMIRQFQQQYFGSRFAATVDGYAAPDFTAVAQAYGLPSVRIGIDDTASLTAALEADGPALIEVMVPQDMPITPKLLIRKPIEEQDPPLDRDLFHSLMLVEPWQTPPDKSEDLFRQAVVSVFKRMKRKDPADPLALLPIRDRGGALKGWLRPITMDWRETLPGISALLCRWRNENQEALSAAPFTATEESTTCWLDQQVLGREDRLLFLITGLAGEPVGHIGLSSFDFAKKFCEVDAVLRGEKQGHPGIMAQALHTMTDWALRELKLQSIGLRVLHGNNRAIAFYLRNGFIPEAEQHDHEYLHMILAQTGGEP